MTVKLVAAPTPYVVSSMATAHPILDAISAARKIPIAILERELRDSVNNTMPGYAQSPSFAATSSNMYNAFAQNMYEKYKVVDTLSDADELWDATIFDKLVHMIVSENSGSLFPMTTSFSSVATLPVFLVYEGASWDTYVARGKVNEKSAPQTAWCDPLGVMAFSKKYLEVVMQTSKLMGQVPSNFNKYVCNGGSIPDWWVAVEFIIIHEVLHFVKNDHYYTAHVAKFAEMEPNAKKRHKALNIMSDMINNHIIVGMGYPQLMNGMFSETINWEHQTSYVTMFKTILDEIATQSKQAQEHSDENAGGQHVDGDANDEADQQDAGDNSQKPEHKDGGSKKQDDRGDKSKQPGDKQQGDKGDDKGDSGEPDGGGEEGDQQGDKGQPGEGQPGEGQPGEGDGDGDGEGKPGEGQGGKPSRSDPVAGTKGADGKRNPRGAREKTTSDLGGDEKDKKPGAGKPDGGKPEGEKGDKGEKGENGADGKPNGDSSEDGEPGESKPGEGDQKGTTQRSSGNEHDAGDHQAPSADESAKAKATMDELDRKMREQARGVNDKISAGAEQRSKGVDLDAERRSAAEQGTKATGKIAKPTQIDIPTDAVMRRPLKPWRKIVQEMIQPTTELDDSYSVADPGSAARAAVAVRSGRTSALNPGEITVEGDGENKVLFIFDNSGSVMANIANANAALWNLVKKGDIAQSILLRFSTNYDAFEFYPKDKKAAKIHIAVLNTIINSGKFPKKFAVGSKVGLAGVLVKAEGGNTYLTDEIRKIAVAALRNNWGVMIFSDSDILYGHNLENLKTIIRIAKGIESGVKLGVVMNQKEDFQLMTSLVGNHKNFSHF